MPLRDETKSKTARATPATIDLLGSWRLMGRSLWCGDTCIDPHFKGAGSVGFIHYLADGRMAYVTAYGPRAPQADPGKETVHDNREDFFAYAGRYTRTGETVVHHLELCLDPTQVGRDYVRTIGVDGDWLTLSAQTEGGKTLRLSWSRIADEEAG